MKNMILDRLKLVFKHLLVKSFHRVMMWERQARVDEMRRRWNLPSTVNLHDSVDLCGNVTIGEHTYINEGSRIASEDKGKVIIGKYCEIGRYVHIMAYTHSFTNPTRDENREHLVVEKDILIGNYVWIGDKVFIREGVVIDDFALIGANSVVTRDVKKFEIVGGVPARHIRFNIDHYKKRDE